MLQLIKSKDLRLPDEVQYVLDGGALLHKIPWQKRSTFLMIIVKYIEYVKNHYNCPIIIFDGYDTATTKDMTHHCRRKGVVGVEVTFDEATILNTNKELFLSNNKNKQKFIKLLGKHLQQVGCKVQYASADADLDIVLQSIEE